MLNFINDWSSEFCAIKECEEIYEGVIEPIFHFISSYVFMKCYIPRGFTKTERYIGLISVHLHAIKC